MEAVQPTQVALKILLLKSFVCRLLLLGQLRNPEATAKLLFPVFCEH